MMRDSPQLLSLVCDFLLAIAVVSLFPSLYPWLPLVPVALALCHVLSHLIPPVISLTHLHLVPDPLSLKWAKLAEAFAATCLQSQRRNTSATIFLEPVADGKGRPATYSLRLNQKNAQVEIRSANRVRAAPLPRQAMPRIRLRHPVVVSDTGVFLVLSPESQSSSGRLELLEYGCDPQLLQLALGAALILLSPFNWLLFTVLALALAVPFASRLAFGGRFRPLPRLGWFFSSAGTRLSPRADFLRFWLATTILIRPFAATQAWGYPLRNPVGIILIGWLIPNVILDARQRFGVKS